MPRDFKLADRLPGPLRRVCSLTFWLQAAAFVIVGGSLLHGGITLRTAEPQASVSVSGGSTAAAAADLTASTTGRPTDATPAGRRRNPLAGQHALAGGRTNRALDHRCHRHSQ